MTKNFYIFRHGQSSYNVEGRIQGHTNNSVLTPEGKLQAANVGKLLQNHKIEIIVSSPLKRAQQTAEIVSSYLNVPIITDEHFIEVNVGVVEGMHYTKVQGLYGELYKRWRSPNLEDMNVCFENGETREHVRKRIFEGLNYYAQNSSYQNIAISGHGITLAQTLIALNANNLEIKNGAVIHITWDNNKWQFINFIS